MKKIISITGILLVLMATVPACAQYTGGEGDGSASAASQAEPAGFSLPDSSPQNTGETNLDALQQAGVVPDTRSLPAQAQQPVPLDGLQKEYHESGELKSVTNYIGGQKEGTAKFYAKDGRLTKEIYYQNDTMIGIKGFTQSKSPGLDALKDLPIPVDPEDIKDKILDPKEAMKFFTPRAITVLLANVFVFFLTVIAVICLALPITANAKIIILGWAYILSALPGFLAYALLIDLPKPLGPASLITSAVGLLLGIGILLRINASRIVALVLTVIGFILILLCFLVVLVVMVIGAANYSMDLVIKSRILLVITCLSMICIGIFLRALTHPDVKEEFLKLKNPGTKT